MEQEQAANYLEFFEPSTSATVVVIKQVFPDSPRQFEDFEVHYSMQTAEADKNEIRVDALLLMKIMYFIIFRDDGK